MQRWQKILAEGFRKANDLLAFLDLPLVEDSMLAEYAFATRVPINFARRMQRGDRYDPLLLQVLAQSVEMRETEGYLMDPLQEREANPVKGLIHKYHGRVLMTLAGVCAVNCRFCFRRHFPYEDNALSKEVWPGLIQYLSEHQEIHEVILSGGDPLMAPDKTWRTLIADLANLTHIKTLRIHSRIPIVLPERLDEQWFSVMRDCPLKKVLVIHANHPNELDDSVAQVLQQFQSIGGLVLNQSVLLKQVNDAPETLIALSQRLFEINVLPYYLHVLDKVQGAAHFDVSLQKAKMLHRQMQEKLPGYLVPRLVCEEAGEPCKTLL